MNCRKWSAWVNAMPGSPPRLHVSGEAYVSLGGNDGHEARLARTVPQGINPTELLLDLTLVPRGDMLIQIPGCIEAKYEEDLGGNPGKYKTVVVLHEGKTYQRLVVETAS